MGFNDVGIRLEQRKLQKEKKFVFCLLFLLLIWETKNVEQIFVFCCLKNRLKQFVFLSSRKKTQTNMLF